MDDRISKYGHQSFDEWPQEEVIAFMAESNIRAPRQLPDGYWIGLYKLQYTLSVCVGITPLECYSYRWCFEDEHEAVRFYCEAEHLKSVPVSTESLVGHRHAGRGALLMKYHPGTEHPRWDA